MDEERARRHLTRITVFSVLLSLLLCLVGAGLVVYFRQTAYDVTSGRMAAETREYKDRLLKQMDKNLQLLRSLATTFSASELIDDPQLLVESIAEIDGANEFVSLLYMPCQGTGIVHTTWSGSSPVVMADLHDCAAEALEEAMTGREAISQVYQSEHTSEKVMVYAVPVYRDNQVVATLAAADTIEIFEDLTSEELVLGGSGYIHLISTDGTFLVRSEHSLVPEPYENIFDSPYFSQQTQEQMAQAMRNGRSLCDTFEIDGDQYHFYLEPIGQNGWYFLCVNVYWGGDQFLNQLFWTVLVVLVLVIVGLNVLLHVWAHGSRKRLRQLMDLAFRDTVTGAENTLHFDQRFQQVVKKQEDYAVAALNVHNFKGVNDLFGKEQGDRVLCYLKTVLDQALGEGEFFCRDAADQFYLYLLDVEEETLRQRLQALIQQVGQRSVQQQGQASYRLSLYAGVAVRSDREKALLALQSIKGTRSVSVAFYDQALYEASRRKHRIESSMDQALRDQEFRLYLQPKYDLVTDRLVGAEALVRWIKEDGTVIFPNDFIPLFETNSFCLKLDMYMVEQACRQLRAWMDRGLRPIPLSVNQSKLLLFDQRYPDDLAALVERYRVPAGLITLEILERVAIADLELLRQQMETLRAKGFRVSLDDFGSGYSSLNMLCRLPVDELKLDRGFLMPVPAEDEWRRQVILRQIMEAAHQLGVSTVAEGIETLEDKENMQCLSCDHGQGYFFARPLEAAEFSEKYCVAMDET